mgnify:CR=1 FL=1
MADATLAANPFIFAFDMGEILSGKVIPVQSEFYYIVSVIVIVLVTIMAFGGIKRIAAVSNKMVPLMAVIYVILLCH